MRRFLNQSSWHSAKTNFIMTTGNKNRFCSGVNTLPLMVQLCLYYITWGSFYIHIWHNIWKTNLGETSEQFVVTPFPAHPCPFSSEMKFKVMFYQQIPFGIWDKTDWWWSGAHPPLSLHFISLFSFIAFLTINIRWSFMTDLTLYGGAVIVYIIMNFPVTCLYYGAFVSSEKVKACIWQLSPLAEVPLWFISTTFYLTFPFMEATTGNTWDMACEAQSFAWRKRHGSSHTCHMIVI